MGTASLQASDCVDPAVYLAEGESLRATLPSAEAIGSIFLENNEAAKERLRESLLNMHSRQLTLDRLEESLFVSTDHLPEMKRFMQKLHAELEGQGFWKLHLRVGLSDTLDVIEHLRLGGALPRSENEMALSFLVDPEFQMSLESELESSSRRYQRIKASKDWEAFQLALRTQKAPLLVRKSDGSLARLTSYVVDYETSKILRIYASSSSEDGLVHELIYDVEDQATSIPHFQWAKSSAEDQKFKLISIFHPERRRLWNESSLNEN